MSMTLLPGLVVVQKTSCAFMGLDVGPCPFQIVHGIEHQDIAGRGFAALHDLPGQEVKETLEYGYPPRGRYGCHLSLMIDGGDACLCGGLVAVRGLERIAARIVGKSQ